MPLKDRNAYNSYMNQYMKNRWERRREEAIIYLGGRCKGCNGLDDLQFHHYDPITKTATIARMSSYSESKFWEEVNKCILLCSDCHKNHHYG